MPTRRSPSTTGSRRTRCWTISAAASSSSISGSPQISGREAHSATGESGATPSAKTRNARSRSVTIATGELPWSTITTEPTRWSRIRRATETAPASGGLVTTPGVMISLSCTARTLPMRERTTSSESRPFRSRPARGPTILPAPPAGSRCSAGSTGGPASRGRSAAARAAASASSASRGPSTMPCERSTSAPRAARFGSPTAPASPPGSAAPAGPGWSPARATSSPRRRFGGWPRTATRS